MKEFAEKTIERLNNACDECIGWNHHKVNAYSHAIRIVKELAEEYNNTSADVREKLIKDIEFAIEASNTIDNYMAGLRNGLRYCLALIDGKEPEFESCNQDSTKNNQGWIPCSDKLPETYEDTKSSDVVLICGYDKHNDYYWQAMGFYVKTESINRFICVFC